MIVEGTHTFPAPQATVYDLLQDPDVLAKVLPGAKSLTRTGDGQFDAVMVVGVGPVTAAEFAVKVELHDRFPPDRFAMKIDGKGAVGFTRGAATVSLSQGEGGTVMQYRADLQIGGKIAAVGQRLLDSTSRMMTRQALDALTGEVEKRLGVTTTAAGPKSRRTTRYVVAAAAAVAALLLVAYWRGLL